MRLVEEAPFPWNTILFLNYISCDDTYEHVLSFFNYFNSNYLVVENICITFINEYVQLKDFRIHFLRKIKRTWKNVEWE